MVKNKKLIAITISDIHLHKWKTHNEENRRTMASLNMLKDIAEIAKANSVPILMPGDLFHGEVGPSLLTLVEKNWPKYFHKNLYAISGNHDQEEKNFKDSQTDSMVQYFHEKGRLINLDFKFASFDDFTVIGIPYITYNKGFNEAYEELLKITQGLHTKLILLIHTDLYGAKEVDGREVNSVENLPKDIKGLFSSVDLVLCGHIHKPQEIIKDHVIMVGAPNQQRKSDANTEFGYWEIYSDFSYQFKALNDMPKFMFYEEGDIPGDDHNYWIMNRASNVQDSEDPDKLEFSSTTSYTKLAHAFLKATGEKRYFYKKALVNALKEVSDDTI